VEFVKRRRIIFYSNWLGICKKKRKCYILDFGIFLESKAGKRWTLGADQGVWRGEDNVEITIKNC